MEGASRGRMPPRRRPNWGHEDLIDRHAPLRDVPERHAGQTARAHGQAVQALHAGEASCKQQALLESNRAARTAEWEKLKASRGSTGAAKLASSN